MGRRGEGGVVGVWGKGAEGVKRGGGGEGTFLVFLSRPVGLLGGFAGA